MMRWAVRLFFPLLAILASVQMFVLKYQVIEKEEELKKIHRQILSDSREIHMLEAEWAVANDPNRLRAFVQAQTKLQPIRATQFTDIENLPIKLAPVPKTKPQFDIPEGEE